MATGTWAVDASGNWSATGNWSGGTVADGATFTANFTNNITATRTVTVDTVRTIGNITFSDNGAAGSAWILAGANALTLDNGGSAPVLTVTTGTTISGPITGTAGFTKAGAGALTISNTTSTLSGTVTLNTTAGYAGRTILSGSGSLSPLSGSGVTYHFATSDSGGYLEYAGNSALATVQASFTSAAANYGFISIYTNGGVSFAPVAAGGVSGYQGRWEVSQDNTVNAPLLVLNEFPASASYLQYDTFGTGTATSTIRIVAVAGGTTAASINMGAGSSGTHTYALEDNSSAPTVYSGGATKLAAQAGTLSLRGTNTSATISGNITVSAGTLALNKQGTGKWILSGANTYTGATSISGGTLSAQRATAFGSTTAGAVTQTGGTIDISGDVTLNKGTVAANTVGVSGATALTSTTGNNEWIIGAIGMNSTTIVDIASGARLKLNNSGALSGVGFGITKNGAGEFELANTDNTFTGAVTVAAGTLTVTKLANSGAGVTSSIGTGAGTSAIALTGTLKYTGTGHSTNRSLTFTGSAPALDASGSGAATFSACTQAAGARTITFTGTSTGNNTFSAALSDGTGAVSVAKDGIGKWVLSNATLNYTGATSCADGTLNLGSINRTLGGALSVSGGTVENSTNTISANTTMTGGTITAELTGNKTLTVNSGTPATLNPTNNANTFTGATSVATGAVLRLITATNPTLAGAGKVLGNSAVSVTGDIKTSATGAQRGQMRYGGNLTFNAGAKLYVGGA